MKNRLRGIIATLFFIFPIFAIFGIDTTHAANLETIKGECMPPEKSYSEVKKMDFGNNLECVLKIRYYPEVQTRASTTCGNLLYVRQMAVRFEFYYNSEDKLARKISEHTLRVTFMYDKDSLVYIFDRDEDVVFNKSKVSDENKKWKSAYSHELLYGEDVCIVSEMISISKYTVFGDRMKYIDNSHIDIMCDPSGNLAINTKNIY